MNKKDILDILGPSESITEREDGSALIVSIISEDLDIVITIPCHVHELFYEARDKNGNILVTDWHDCYGDLEIEDFKETLLDIREVMTSPKLRVASNGKAIEAFSLTWYYFFGEFNTKMNR
tara:strand:+ start:129 stop:491 length:363 start_codon:yes stop_codon:yes gene_type:complete